MKQMTTNLKSSLYFRKDWTSAAGRWLKNQYWKFCILLVQCTGYVLNMTSSIKREGTNWFTPNLVWFKSNHRVKSYTYLYFRKAWKSATGRCLKDQVRFLNYLLVWCNYYVVHKTPDIIREGPTLFTPNFVCFKYNHKVKSYAPLSFRKACMSAAGRLLKKKVRFFRLLFQYDDLIFV